MDDTIRKRYVSLKQGVSIQVKSFPQSEVWISVMKLDDNYGWLTARRIVIPISKAKEVSKALEDVL
ncbi:MAG: hypothetical protein NTV88_03605 [Candidatus Micrarchaeota archaeon]|nr:hypothetical protein [Candidatus Micrarchaeota archaeon]